MRKAIEHIEATAISTISKSDFLELINRFKEKKINIIEIFSPEGFGPLMPVSKNNYGKIAFISGFLGFVLAILSQVYFHNEIVMHFSGFNTFPLFSFLIPAIVLTIFFAGISVLISFYLKNKLFPGQQNHIVDKRNSQDLYTVLIEKNVNVSEILKDFENYEVYEITYSRQMKIVPLPIKVKDE
jgi:hypothetical protein